MQIKKADFVISNTDYKRCPKPDKPEYAFIGRSNVGKSSLINMLTGQSSLAKTSSRPGKTQLINHFLINENWYLVDLPGYGWASVGKQKRDSFSIMIKDYLLYRENLLCTFALIDIRHEMQNNDAEFMQWLGENGVPFVIIFTKADKLSQPQIQSQIAQYKRKMAHIWEEMPQYFVTSAVEHKGKTEILNLIQQTNLLKLS